MRRQVSVRAFGLALFGAVALIAAWPLTAAPRFRPVPREVTIDNFTFTAPTVTVPVGTTVTWTNRDDIPHTVVSTDKVFKSKVLDTEEKFSFTFTTAGTVPYFCSIHPKMTGKVVVQ
jgi:plastocyanin